MGMNIIVLCWVDQMFFVLLLEDIVCICCFVELCEYVVGEVVFCIGQCGIGLILVFVGWVDISQYDGVGQVVEIVYYGLGEFMGEVSGLIGKLILVDGVVVELVQVLWFSFEQLWCLIVVEVDLGEWLMCVLILCCISLIEFCVVGLLVIVEVDDFGCVCIGNFLCCNGFLFCVVMFD